jgi:hypothetical protein
MILKMLVGDGLHGYTARVVIARNGARLYPGG